MHVIKAPVAADPLCYMQRNIRSMAGDPLVGADQLVENRSALCAAVSRTKTLHVTGTDQLFHFLYGIRRRLDLNRAGKIIVDKGVENSIQNITAGLRDITDLLLTAIRKDNILFLHMSGCPGDLHAVIAHSFKIADTVQDFHHFALIVRRQTFSVNPYDICGKSSLTAVNKAFILFQPVEGRLVITGEKAVGQLIVFTKPFAHGTDQTGTLSQRKAGCSQEDILQLPDLRILLRLLYLLFPDDHIRQLFHLTGKGQKDQRCHQVKCQVHIGDISAVHGLLQHGKPYGIGHAVDYRREKNCTDDIEQHIGKRHLFGLFIRADSAQNYGHAFADILADDNGNGNTIGNASCSGKRLQDADRSAGALDHSGQRKTGKNTEDRVAEGCKQFLEGLAVLQGTEHLLHDRHTEKEDAQAKENTAEILCSLLLHSEEHQCTDADEDRGKGGWLQQAEKFAARSQIAQTEELRRHRTSHIRAKHYRNSLHQIHDACVDKTDQDQRCGCRALDDARYDKSKSPALYSTNASSAASGQVLQYLSQSGTRKFFQHRTHQRHAVQKKPDAAQTFYHRKKIHTALHILVFGQTAKSPKIRI